MRVGDSDMYDEDLIWSQYSDDKTDIGRELMRVIRAMNKALPLSEKLAVLSVGSGSEPQFKILEAAFQGGVNLLDIDSVPLEIIKKYAEQRWIKNVSTIQEDYTKVLINQTRAQQFQKNNLHGRKQDLITLHHSLYYCEEAEWTELFKNLYQKILADRGAIHAVMMSSKSQDHSTTTWLYNHFAGKFFNCRNDQDLKSFGRELAKNRAFSKAVFTSRTHEAEFWTDDFEKFMAVIWMILLYPNVHEYTLEQREEITEYIYNNFWVSKKPLVQKQDHLVILRSLGELL
ncbi:MAG: class I SAM-dependent methyltransferase [Candidatus Sabulitectum sp.]|nr:class I SAM-dependent methyltransferase [Candidatus Sabulitectum sp.]